MNLSRLCDLRSNQKGRIASINIRNRQDLHTLLAAGVLPHARVSVLHNDANHVLFFADCNELMVDRESASGILVELDHV